MATLKQDFIDLKNNEGKVFFNIYLLSLIKTPYHEGVNIKILCDDFEEFKVILDRHCVKLIPKEDFDADAFANDFSCAVTCSKRAIADTLLDGNMISDYEDYVIIDLGGLISDLTLRTLR